MRKAAEVIGLMIISIIAGGLLIILIGSLFEGESMTFDAESLGMAFLSLLTVISVLLAWIKTRIGVWFVLGSGLLFSIFALLTAGSNHLLAVMSVGGPLIIGGLLILLSRNDKKPATKKASVGF
jgi:hypothetical protein